MNEDILIFQLQIFLFNFTLAKLQGSIKPRNQMIYHLGSMSMSPNATSQGTIFDSDIYISYICTYYMFRKTNATSRNWYEFATVYIISIYPEYPYGPYRVHRISAGCPRDACNWSRRGVVNKMEVLVLYFPIVLGKKDLPNSGAVYQADVKCGKEKGSDLWSW